MSDRRPWCKWCDGFVDHRDEDNSKYVAKCKRPSHKSLVEILTRVIDAWDHHEIEPSAGGSDKFLHGIMMEAIGMINWKSKID